MDEFGPLLIVILIWVFVGLPAAIAKKAKEQKEQGGKQDQDNDK